MTELQSVSSTTYVVLSIFSKTGNHKILKWKSILPINKGTSRGAVKDRIGLMRTFRKWGSLIPSLHFKRNNENCLVQIFKVITKSTYHSHLQDRINIVGIPIHKKKIFHKLLNKLKNKCAYKASNKYLHRSAPIKLVKELTTSSTRGGAKGISSWPSSCKRSRESWTARRTPGVEGK